MLSLFLISGCFFEFHNDSKLNTRVSLRRTRRCATAWRLYSRSASKSGAWAMHHSEAAFRPTPQSCLILPTAGCIKLEDMTLACPQDLIPRFVKTLKLWAANCALEGVDYSSYGINATGNSLTLNLLTQNGNITTASSPRVCLLSGDQTYDIFKLLN